jgi:hypothetical protein
VIKSRRKRWTVHVALIRKDENCVQHFGWKPRREDNIRMEHMEIVWEDVNWMHLAQDRDQWWAPVNMVMNLRVTRKVGNFLTR